MKIALSLRFIICAIGLICLFSSCDDSDSFTEPDSDEDLIGSWVRIDRIPSGRTESDFRYFNMESTYRFGTDAQFSFTVDLYGFEDENPDEIIGSSVRKGTFEIVGDSIFFRDTETTSWEIGFRPEPETRILSGERYGSRFTILERTLTLSYLSYPADAPVQTQMEYVRSD
ncbi:MAG: hypothetical protein AAGC43_13560 [Bacteroidota bacterium]